MILTLCLLPIIGQADEIEYVDLQSRTTQWHVSYKLHEDYTVEIISEFKIQALTENAVKDLKNRSFSYSTSIEKFEVLEAYTIKPNGDHIDVPKNNYQVTVNKGNNDGGPIFSDRTKISIVFPDLELNDSIFMRLKNIETEPMFPGHFGTSGSFWSQNSYEDVKITFDLPKNLKFKHQVRGMEEDNEIKGDRQLIELTYKNPKPVKIERTDFSVWDTETEVGYALSTFKNYSSISRAYGDRASPKAIPTDRIKLLANEIVGKESDKSAQARLLYNWVAKNISYAGNCIGVGAVVPHDTDFILDNRMGDCKDHATLLQALYTSAGIESVQALINSGSIYSLPEIPLVTSVNHVITYLPEWDKFVDSTSSTTPFDLLPLPIAGKPVILVSGFKQGQRTPATVSSESFQNITSDMTIQPDGSVVGNISLNLKGYPAAQARASWRNVTPEQEKQWLKKSFSSRNQIGSATVKKDDPAPLLSNFNYSFEFDRPEFIMSKGTGGFHIGPLINSSLPLYSFLSYPKEDIEGFDVQCGNGNSVEYLTYKIPENMKILAKPENFEINENHIVFMATYELDDGILKVVRKIDDQTPGHVCTANLINKQRQTLIKIAENMKSQVIYQH
jgi:hypothetical protein